MRFLLSLLLGCLLPLLSLAEPPELLVPVTDSERAIVEANNPYFLAKETYFAKQYRIVTVNAPLLITAEKIKVSLFDDQAIVLEVDSVDVHPKGLTVAWNGHFVEPRLTVADLRATELSPDEAKTLLPDLHKVGIFAAEVSFDEASRIKYQYNFARFEEFRARSEPALYDVVFLLQTVVLPKVYELRPLASDPQYHVLVEWDPEKTFSVPTESDHAFTASESAENKAKRERYLDFLRSLGPDPRPANIHEE